MPRKVPSPSNASAPASLSPLATAVIVIVLLTAAGLYIKNTFFSHKSADLVTNTAAPVATDDTNSLIEKVSRHIIVKQGEKPTVATIKDVSILKQNNPVFYQDAQNGDHLFVWSDKAVLYSSSKDLILAVLPITAAPTQTTTQAATSTVQLPPAQEQAVVEVRNGSQIVGLGKTSATQLKDAGLNVLPATAAKSTTAYLKTVIYVAAGKQFPQTLEKIQSLVGGTVVTNLDAELPAKGDILVIIGADAKR